MHKGRFTYLLFSVLVSFLAMTSSCQKDPAVMDPNTGKTGLNADSANVTSIAALPGNYLAASGILKIKIKDSTYIFDASRDSIAFVNVHVDDNTQYFGITAINKEHTLSFGISASGFVYNHISSSIAGSQFLFSPDNNKSGLEYTLSRYAGQKNFGNINIIQYKQGKELAKGTFYTFLAKDDKADSPFYRVEGSFDLQLK